MDRRTPIALLLAILLALGAAGAAMARGGDDPENKSSRDGRGGDDDRKGPRGEAGDDDRRGHGPRHGSKGGHLLFQNDHVSVLFKQGGSGKAKPDLRVVFNGSEDDEKSGYRVKILRLYEAEANSTAFHGRLPHMGLTGAKDWNVQTTEGNESLTLTMVRAEAQGIVTLVWRINTTSAEVKYDLKVDNWRWAANSTGHRLVLDMLVVGKNLHNATGANVSVEDSGYISWASTGAVTYPNGTTATANVTAERKGDDDHKEGKDEEGETGAHLLLAFDAPPGYSGLDYDPTFGVQSNGAETRGTPGVAPVAVAGALAVAALVAARRRKA